MKNPEEALKVLVVAFVMTELHSNEYSHLLENTKKQEEIDNIVDTLTNKIYKEVHEYFTSQGSNVMLVGETGNISINNILLFDADYARSWAVENAFASTPQWQLKDFIK